MGGCRAALGVGRVLLGGSMSAALKIHNLTVSYRQRPAVHHVDAVFGSNEMWALCGPNGAGKSTLLKCMMGLIQATTGSVEWQGLSRCDLAYLPQQSDIDRSQPLTVYELAAMGLWYEIGFFGRVHAAQHARIQAALERVSMLDFAHRSIGQLSNGQFQRVLFARMLAQNARFLLLDEPFNAVDAKTTAALLDMLANYRNQYPCTVITVLHDYEQVRSHFPHTLLIAREKIAAGATVDVLSPANLQAANAAMRLHDSPEWCTA